MRDGLSLIAMKGYKSMGANMLLIYAMRLGCNLSHISVFAYSARF